MSSQHNIFQQVFGLSLASNEVGECKGTSLDLQQRLANQVEKDLTIIGTGWTVVWGPVVWKDNAEDATEPPGNAWFVAKNDSVMFDDGKPYCAYVVAIAGTAGIYDWIVEDLSIIDAVDLNAWLEGPGGITTPPKPLDHDSIPGGNPAMSSGFSHALFQVMNNAPHTGSPGASLTLPNFLKSISQSPASKLVFTGHSLGAALSPGLAFMLLKAGFLGSFAEGNVHVYPTAGPTPGNIAFANAFTILFPPTSSEDQLKGYQHWNCNITHPLDVVPQAFCQVPNPSNMLLSNIVDLYGTLPFFDSNWALEAGIIAIRVVAGEFYYPIKSSTFTSKLPKPAVPPNTTKLFLDEAHLQHVDPYGFEILGKAVPPSLCSIAKEKEWLTHPVLGFLWGKAEEKNKKDKM